MRVCESGKWMELAGRSDEARVRSKIIFWKAQNPTDAVNMQPIKEHSHKLHKTIGWQGSRKRHI